MPFKIVIEMETATHWQEISAGSFRTAFECLSNGRLDGATLMQVRHARQSANARQLLFAELQGRD